jgi:hypothetical protein
MMMLTPALVAPHDTQQMLIDKAIERMLTRVIPSHYAAQAR